MADFVSVSIINIFYEYARNFYKSLPQPSKFLPDCSNKRFKKMHTNYTLFSLSVPRSLYFIEMQILYRRVLFENEVIKGLSQPRNLTEL